MIRRYAVLTGAVVALAGCGFYSVRFHPPAPVATMVPHAPLALRLGLGEVASYAHGQAVLLTPEALHDIDTAFVAAVDRTGAVRAAVPRGAPADLVYDTVQRLYLVPGQSKHRRAYQAMAVPLAIALPGFPYPWEVHVDRLVRLWGAVGGERVLIGGYEREYVVEAWARSYLAAVLGDPLHDADIDYQAAQLARVLERERPLFTLLEGAVRAGDVAALHRLEGRLGR
jgi:hypothetical protein